MDQHAVYVQAHILLRFGYQQWKCRNAQQNPAGKNHIFHGIHVLNAYAGIFVSAHEHASRKDRRRTENCCNCEAKKKNKLNKEV